MKLAYTLAAHVQTFEFLLIYVFCVVIFVKKIVLWLSGMDVSYFVLHRRSKALLGL